LGITAPLLQKTLGVDEMPKEVLSIIHARFFVQEGSVFEGEESVIHEQSPTQTAIVVIRLFKDNSLGSLQ